MCFRIGKILIVLIPSVLAIAALVRASNPEPSGVAWAGISARNRTFVAYGIGWYPFVC